MKSSQIETKIFQNILNAYFEIKKSEADMILRLRDEEYMKTGVKNISKDSEVMNIVKPLINKINKIYFEDGGFQLIEDSINIQNLNKKKLKKKEVKGKYIFNLWVLLNDSYNSIKFNLDEINEPFSRLASKGEGILFEQHVVYHINNRGIYRQKEEDDDFLILTLSLDSLDKMKSIGNEIQSQNKFIFTKYEKYETESNRQDIVLYDNSFEYRKFAWKLLNDDNENYMPFTILLSNVKHEEITHDIYPIYKKQFNQNITLICFGLNNMIYGTDKCISSSDFFELYENYDSFVGRLNDMSYLCYDSDGYKGAYKCLDSIKSFICKFELCNGEKSIENYEINFDEEVKKEQYAKLIAKSNDIKNIDIDDFVDGIYSKINGLDLDLEFECDAEFDQVGGSVAIRQSNIITKPLFGFVKVSPK